jgi:multiple sugar transport system permease protein
MAVKSVPYTSAAPLRARYNRRRLDPSKILVLVFLTVVAVVSLFPLYWIFATALTPAAATVKIPPDLIPANPTLDNFVEIAKAGGTTTLTLPFLAEPLHIQRVWVWLFNTMSYAVTAMSIHLLFDSMAAYALAKRRFPGARPLFWLILAAIMIPPQVTLIPLFFQVRDMGFNNSFLGLLLPGLADVIGIFLLKQFMQTIPTELEEAARIDGASEWQIYSRVIMPLSVPALAVTAIFAFQRYWNNFLWPLVITHSPDLFTLQVGLSYIQTGEFGTNYGLLMSGAALPMILVFFAFQKYFVQGLRIGAVKG